MKTIEDTYLPFLTSISKDTFVMLDREWALELCVITEKKGAPRIRSRRKLKLPAVQPGTHTVLEKFDETSSGTGLPSTLRHPSTLPLTDPRSDSILAFYVKASNRSEKRTLLFSVFTSTLHSFTVTTRTKWWSRRGGGEPYIVSWDEWGPELTRWINIGDFPVIRTLSGTRCVISETSTGRVRMLDFNPECLPRMEDLIKRENGETGGRDWLVTTTCPTIIPAGKVFQCDIVSKLPYYELRKSGVEVDFSFFIDDKRVVLIRVYSNHYNVPNIRLISNICFE